MPQRIKVAYEEELLAHPIVRQRINEEAIPGTIRKAEHFLRFMRKVVKCLKDELAEILQPRIISPLTILNRMQQSYYIDQRPLKAARERLSMLMNTLQVD